MITSTLRSVSTTLLGLMLDGPRERRLPQIDSGPNDPGIDGQPACVLEDDKAYPGGTFRRVTERGRTGVAMLTRRDFLKVTGGSTVAWYVATQTGWIQRATAAIPGGTLEPNGYPAIRHAPADPPGDAAGRQDPAARRPAHRHLRDLDEAVLPADPSRDDARDDGLGIRAVRSASRRGCSSTTPLRSRSRPDGTGRSA